MQHCTFRQILNVFPFNSPGLNSLRILSSGFHQSSSVCSSPGKPRLVKLCELNKTLYIHRNAEFGPQPIFYRGQKRIDTYQNYLDKQKKFKEWITFSRQVEVGESPEDDVYLTSLFKTKQYALSDAIDTLKSYTVLDLTDQETPIKLTFNLAEITKGKGKRKKAVTFFETTDLPHHPGSTNKVCLFTTDEAKMEVADSIGVHAVGSQDIVTKILNGSVVCDAYFASSEYLKDLFDHTDLRAKLKGQTPNKHFHVIDDVAELKPYVISTIMENVTNPRVCEVIVGKPRQSSEELIENVMTIVPLIHAKAESNKVEQIIDSVSISCSTEPLTVDLSSIIPDD